MDIIGFLLPFNTEKCIMHLNTFILILLQFEMANVTNVCGMMKIILYTIALFYAWNMHELVHDFLGINTILYSGNIRQTTHLQSRN